MTKIQILNKLLLVGLITLSGCKPKTSPSHKGEVFVNIKTMQVPGGWGYRIYMDTTLYIDQPIIPAVGGNQPFTSEKDARNTARLVLEKIAKAESPAVDSAELVKIGVVWKKQ